MGPFGLSYYAVGHDRRTHTHGHTKTHTHALSLSLTHTHTHTHGLYTHALDCICMYTYVWLAAVSGAVVGCVATVGAIHSRVRVWVSAMHHVGDAREGHRHTTNHQTFFLSTKSRWMDGWK
mmetsp:Transcript_21740/g.53266  ORF Transcript_21740/g.53266 Transcript_21740/m.53266 type:complete len:121 (+) Transcript_21740:927-1289(+)